MCCSQKRESVLTLKFIEEKNVMPVILAQEVEA